MKTKIKSITRSRLADIQTLIGIYLKLQDIYPESALLESSGHHSLENSFSFIGIEPLARFCVKDSMATGQYPCGATETYVIDGERTLEDLLSGLIHSFEVSGEESRLNGFFGYTAYDAVRYFEDIPAIRPDNRAGVPEMIYILYRYVVAVDHFRNEMTVTENIPEGGDSGQDGFIALIDSRNFPRYGFRSQGEVRSLISDKEYKDMVARGIRHCLRGDVFQIVLSRRFEQRFTSDDFKVYRALRSINPSPYLFYFDFG